MGTDSNQESKGALVEDLTRQMNQMDVENDEDGMSIDLDDKQSERSDRFELQLGRRTNNPDDETRASRGQTLRRLSSKSDNILIVTNLDSSVFNEQLLKSKFESLFTHYDANVAFRYLKSFKRVRLDFTSGSAAETARINLDNYRFGNSSFRCYPAQMIKLQTNISSLDQESSVGDNESNMKDSPSKMYLKIPKPTKQFLISPPASPPVGWEPVTENSPCIDVQLISAIANLVPGQVHEIHAGSESQPGIYVEVCEEAQFEAPKASRSIPKTPNPCFQMQQ